MPSYTTVAIVLRRLNYGETDKILTLYSRDHGRLSAIAKGARKAISRLSGATEALTCTRFQLATGKSLEIVTQCEVQESFTPMRQDLPRMAQGLYFLDLIDHSVEDHEPNPELFDLLYVGLSLIQRITPPDLIARWFEIQLLDNLGYAPDLTSCAICREAIPGTFASDEMFALSISQGGALCPRHARPGSNDDHSRLDRDALSLLQALVPIDTTRAGTILLHLNVPNLKSLDQSRLALRRYLRYRLERDFKSLEFLDSLRHMA